MRILRIACRGLLKQPGFSAAAIGALALGISAPTALFAVVSATLLRPLPYASAEDIYTVRTTMTDGRFTIGLVASAEMNALRKTTDLVSQSALVQSTPGSVQTDAGVRQVSAYAVSSAFFDLFGLPMERGRAFNDDDVKSWFGSRIVLSDHAWRTIFGGDPDIIGHTIKVLDGPGSIVVGIAPAAFDIPRNADLWFVMPPSDTIGHAYDGFIRLKPGATPEMVQARLGGMWDALAKQYPDQDKNRVFVMRILLTTIVGDLGPVVVIAFVATGVLLLLAMVNVATLLLARASTRGREIGVRTALGATRGDLLMQLLAESLTIAFAATLVALPLALIAVRSIVAIGGSQLPRLDGLQIDLRVFAFSAVTMIVAGIVVGLVPLTTLSKGGLTALLNEGGRGALHGRATRRLLGGMIVAEVALAVALVAGAGRLLLSMNNLLTMDPGFSSAGRLAIDVNLPVRPYRAEPDRIYAWQADVDASLRALGATSVGVASSVPLRHEWDSTAFVDITGRPTDPANRPNARERIVSPGFFDVMGMKMLAGRAFTETDRRGGDPAVIVNESWARKFLPGLDPLRERVAPGVFNRVVDGKMIGVDAPIVGVVRDVPYVGLPIPAEPTLYLPDAQVIGSRKTIVITTTDGRPERLIPEIRAALMKIDPHVPVDFETMSDAVSASLTWPKLGLLLMATFGVLGLVLAATGVFGVISFVTSQRAGEMAVRLALGGPPSHIFGVIMLQTVRLGSAGLAVGVLLAWWLGQPMARYVFNVTAANWIVLGGSAVVVFVVALAATLPSARRAAAIEPARVFRI